MSSKLCWVFVLWALFCARPLAVAQAVSSETAPPPQSVLDVDWLDRSVDPCSDFFAYSCGGWLKKNPIPADQTSWSVYSQLQDENKLLLRQILEQAEAPSPKRNAITQKIGDYYAACMDENAIEAVGARPLQADLARIAGLQSKSQMADLVGALAADSFLFSFHSVQDFKDSTQVIANADQGGLGLPDRDYYLKLDAKSRKLRADYVAHVEKMFELLGDSPPAARREAKSVLRIETALARGSMNRVDRRNPYKLYHKMNVPEFEVLTPDFQWTAYLTRIGRTNLQSVNVTYPEFFKVMNRELKRENLKNWQAYLRWHLVHANAAYLSSPFVNASFAFYGKELQGAQEIQPRWKRCVGYVDDDLGEALGQAYVEKYFSPEAKQRALQMVRQIEDAMQSDIESLPWMSAETKARALEKLRAVSNKIGYPDKWRDYSSLTISRDDEMGNVARAREFEFHRVLNKIGRPVDRGEWEMTPPTVNAYYSPQMNDINFPAGILQPPLFDPASDDAPNYGDTGGTIGHELTHGFDDEGRRFDAQGNLRDWWTAEDARQFTDRASCISDQYSRYTIVDNIKINGKLTLGEDVADLGGLILAYMAWREQTKGQQLEPIQGFTPEQRFFIGYGQSWCSNTREETQRLWATIDPHSPDRYRANGVVSNLPEFQQAFHCKAGAAMVRKNQCRVW